MSDSVNKYTFRKSEKLCSQIQIDNLFKQGKSFTSGQFRLIYFESDFSKQPPVQILVAVPKKNLRHAVTRNRMKRLIREAFRLQKHKLIDACQKLEKHYDIALVFNGKQCVSQAETLSAINVLLVRLIHAHEKNSE